MMMQRNLRRINKGGLAAALIVGVAAFTCVPTLAATSSSSTKSDENPEIQNLQRQLDQLKIQLHEQQTVTAQATEAAHKASAEAQETAIKYRGLKKPEYTSSNGIQVSVHGWLQVFGFYQNKDFSIDNGVNAEIPQFGTKGTSGIDLKRSRIWLNISSVPLVGTWNAGAYLEMDFAGGYSGNSPYNSVMELPRLRLFYMDLNHPTTGTTIRIGQQWTPMTPSDNFPPSLVNRLPLGYDGGGFIGWRNPGITWIQQLNPRSKGIKWQTELGLYNSTWDGPGDNTEWDTAANAGFSPQIQARLRMQYKNWIAFIAGTFDRQDFKNAETYGVQRSPSFNSVGYEAGVNWKPGPFEFGITAFAGRGLAPLFANFANFANNFEAGGYVIAKYHVTKHWNIGAFHGLDRPNRKQLMGWMNRTNNNGLGFAPGTWVTYSGQQSSIMITWHAKPVTLGFQWLHAKRNEQQGTAFGPRRVTYGSQFALGAEYDF